MAMGDQGTAGVRVLIVDDMLQVRRDLSMALPLAGEAAGLRLSIVGEAAGGEEAIRQAAALVPDLVLMDLLMPGLDGFAATRLIKQAFPAVKVLVLSVLDAASAGGQARQAGADGFIEKGCPVAQMVAAIAGLFPAATAGV